MSSSLYQSQIESYEHQDNSDVRHQPFPEFTPEEQVIYADDNRYHQRYVKAVNHVPVQVIMPLLMMLQAAGHRFFQMQQVMEAHGADAVFTVNERRSHLPLDLQMRPKASTKSRYANGRAQNTVGF